MTVGPNWPDKGRSYSGDNFFAFLHGLDGLENLTFVDDGAKRAGNEALTAGYALVVVDFGFSVFVGMDGVHAAAYRDTDVQFLRSHDTGRLPCTCRISMQRS